jgi:hypothetical protein
MQNGDDEDEKRLPAKSDYPGPRIKRATKKKAKKKAKRKAKKKR